MIDLGAHKLRFLETPHVHHWDSMMVFEETTGSLFPADLFIQPGDQPPVVRENLGKEMCHLYRDVGIFAAREPVITVVNRLEKLDSNWIHPCMAAASRKKSSHTTSMLYVMTPSSLRGRYLDVHFQPSE